LGVGFLYLITSGSAVSIPQNHCRDVPWNVSTILPSEVYGRSALLPITEK